MFCFFIRDLVPWQCPPSEDPARATLTSFLPVLHTSIRFRNAPSENFAATKVTTVLAEKKRNLSREPMWLWDQGPLPQRSPPDSPPRPSGLTAPSPAHPTGAPRSRRREGGLRRFGRPRRGPARLSRGSRVRSRARRVWEAAPGPAAPALPPRARGSSPFAPGPAAAERRTLLAESPPASQGSGPRRGRRRPGNPLQGPDPRTPEEEAASEAPDRPAPRTRLSPGERPPTRPHPPGVTPAGPGKSGARDPREALPRRAGLLPTLSSTP